jgi:hypothetical protein
MLFQKTPSLKAHNHLLMTAVAIALSACSGSDTTQTTSSATSATPKSAVVLTPNVGSVLSFSPLNKVLVTPKSIIVETAIVKQTSPIPITAGSSAIDPTEIYLTNELGVNYIVNRTPRRFKEVLVKINSASGDDLRILDFGTTSLQPFTKVSLDNFKTGTLPNVVNTKAFYNHVIDTKYKYDPACFTSPKGYPQTNNGPLDPTIKVNCKNPLKQDQLDHLLLRNTVYNHLFNSADGYNMMSAFSIDQQTYQTATKTYTSKYGCDIYCGIVITPKNWMNDTLVVMGNARELTPNFISTTNSLYYGFGTLTKRNYFGHFSSAGLTPMHAQHVNGLLPPKGNPANFDELSWNNYLRDVFHNYSWNNNEGVVFGLTDYAGQFLTQKIIDTSAIPTEEVPKYVFLTSAPLNNNTTLTVYKKGVTGVNSLNFQYLSKETNMFWAANNVVTTNASQPYITITAKQAPAERGYIRLYGTDSTEVMSQAFYPSDLYSQTTFYGDINPVFVVTPEQWARIPYANDLMYNDLTEGIAANAENICKGMSSDMNKDTLLLAKTSSLTALRTAIKNKTINLSSRAANLIAYNSFNVKVLHNLVTGVDTPISQFPNFTAGIACSALAGSIYQSTGRTKFRGRL